MIGSDDVIFIRDIRKARHMTMKELGKKVGVTESAIQLYETGKRKPDYEMLLKLSEALDCTVLDLLHGFPKQAEIEKMPWEPPDDLADLFHVWDKLSDEDKAIIKIITKKYLSDD